MSEATIAKAPEEEMADTTAGSGAPASTTSNQVSTTSSRPPGRVPRSTHGG